jgi:hypothetical protein
MSWKATLTDGSALEEPAIRELWSFQLSLLRLKPHVSPEKDFEKFAADCRQARRVLRLRDGNGRLVGSVVPLVYEGSFQSERFRLVVPEYFYLAPELRGRAAVSWAWFRCLTPLLYPRGTRVFVGGIGYPTGTLLLESLVGSVWLYGEPQIPPLAAHVLERIVVFLADSGWDAASGQADMSILPARPSEKWLARMQRRALYRRYVERCPRWQEGWALPSVTEYSSWKVVKTALQVPRRWWRHHTR